MSRLDGIFLFRADGAWGLGIDAGMTGPIVPETKYILDRVERRPGHQVEADPRLWLPNDGTERGFEPIHPKAMPVISPWDEVKGLQRPLLDDGSMIVAREPDKEPCKATYRK